MAKKTKNFPITEPNFAWSKMSQYWDKIEALRGGTEEMHRQGTTWLPRWDGESKKNYDRRLLNSVLYGAYTDTVAKMLDKPFSRPVTITGELPSKLARVPADVDRTGKDMTAFAASVFESAIHHGVAHILVDYPTIPVGATLEDEKEARPTFVLVEAPELFYWRASGPGSTVALEEIRIKEVQVAPDPGVQWVDKEKRFVRVYRPDRWELYQCLDETKGDYDLVDQGVNTLGYVPLITVYFRRTGFMTGRPILDELAWCNIAHYRSSSAQTNALDVSRFNILFGTGFTEEETPTVISPNRIIVSGNSEAKLIAVETNGAAIMAGERDLRALEQRMEVLGAQPFVQRAGVETATGKSIHESKTTSGIQRCIIRTETALMEACRLGAKWTKETLPEDFAVGIYSDFAIPINADTEGRLLLDSVEAGRLPNEIYIRELQRRGTLDERIDPVQATKDAKAAFDEEKKKEAELKPKPAPIPAGGLPKPPQ